MKKLLLSLVFLAFAYMLKAQLVPNSLVSTGHGTIYFYQYKPPHYKTTPGSNPLIISLGGVYERGNGATELNNLFTGGIPKLLSQGATMEFKWDGVTEGFVVLAPQLPATTFDWSPFYVDEMIKYGVANLNVDPNRIFLTGYSLGGVGTWLYATSGNPSATVKLAGIIPISSGYPSGNPEWCTIATNKLATWSFQGAHDDVYQTQPTAIVNTINNSCPLVDIPAIDTTYPDGAHGPGTWDDRVYDTTNNHHYPNIYQWMLKVNRNLKLYPDNENPLPAIAGGANITANTPLRLTDFPTLSALPSHDPDDIVMNYLWEQVSGPTQIRFGAIANDPAAAFWQFPAASVFSEINFSKYAPPGDYVFRVRVKDYLTTKPGHTQFANVTVSVVIPNGHSAPGVNAGGDHVLGTSETFYQIPGLATFYGPTGAIVYTWRFIKGPTIPVGAPQPAVTNYFTGGTYSGNDQNARFVNMDIPGDYQFELAVSNGLLPTPDIGRDTVILTRLASSLPVNFAYFKGENAGSKNVLTWATTSEINSDRFDVQRSTDGISFTTAGTVPSKGGATVTEYSFDDSNAPFGISYYRLSQVDKDGKTTLSKTISVNNRKTGVYIEQYPNPVHDNLTVNVQGVVTGKIKVIVADMQGKTIMQQEWQKDQSSLKKIISVGSLQNGVYQMIISIGQEKSVSSFVKY